MSEILVRSTDKGGVDIIQHCRLSQRADVIVACPDGWPWSAFELTNPEWRILKVPQLPLSEAMALCAAELPVDPQDMRRTLLKRKFKFDISNLSIPQAFKNYVADDTRAQPTFTVNLGLAQLRALVITKASVPDPQIL